MLFQPYLTIKPIEWAQIDASYNLAYDIETKKRYPGQVQYTANLTLQPFEWAPSLKLGYMQPVVGIDWDDHTYMTRQMVTQTGAPPILDCDYIELGGQLDYQSLDWLGVTLGVFDSKNLSVMTNKFIQDNTMSGLFKVSIHPSKIGYGLTGFFGGSLFINGKLKSDDGVYFDNKYFAASSFFCNIGMGDKFALMAEFMRTEKFNRFDTDKTITNNYTIEFDYMLMEPVIAYARIENGNTKIYKLDETEFKGSRYTLGAKLFLLPGIALLPEFKIYDRSHVDSYSSQFACQLHVFF